MKTKSTIIALISAFIVVFFGILINHYLSAINLSPYEFLQERFEDYPSHYPVQLLCQFEVDENTTVVVYLTEEERIWHYFVKKAWYGYSRKQLEGGNWSGGFMDDVPMTPVSSYLAGEVFLGDKEKDLFCWGLFRDEGIESIYLEGNKVEILETSYPGLRFFWYMRPADGTVPYPMEVFP